MARLLDELAAGGDASEQKNEHRDVQPLRSLVEVGKKWSRANHAAPDVYKQLRAHGQRHGRALRSAADRLLRLLVAMLRNGTHP